MFSRHSPAPGDGETFVSPSGGRRNKRRHRPGRGVAATSRIELFAHIRS
jgi:hypothetical protein